MALVALAPVVFIPMPAIMQFLFSTAAGIAFISGYVMRWPINPVLRARRRRAAGLCVWCEYDLTRNVSGVCPECGTAIEPD